MRACVRVYVCVLCVRVNLHLTVYATTGMISALSWAGMRDTDASLTVQGKVTGLCPRITTFYVGRRGKANCKQGIEPTHRAQELRESRGGRPGFPVPNKPDGFCGSKATLKRNAPNPTPPAYQQLTSDFTAAPSGVSRFGLAVRR